MSQHFDFAIISREDRGHWLAGELQSHGHKTALLDLSAQLGRWAPEDLEGPFGIMRSPKLSAKQWGRTTEGHSIKDAESGFVLWLRNKPIELKSPNFHYQKQRHKDLALAETYFLEADGAEPSEVQLINEKLDLRSFEDNWLVQLGHNFSANVQLPNASSIRPMRPFPIFYNYFLREPSRYSKEQSLVRLEEEGVSIFTDTFLQDVSFDKRKTIDGMEVKTGNSTEFIKAKTWILLLSEEELSFLNDKLFESLFQRKALLPRWSWVRYRMKFTEHDSLDVLPVQALLIDDIQLPWSHDNFIQMFRSGTQNEFDFWVKIPRIERFRKDYLEEIHVKILNKIKKRIPGLELQKVSMPAEYLYAYEDLGPSPYACFEREELVARKTKLPKNLIFEGPETQNRLDLGYRLMRQQKSLELLLHLEDSNDRKIYKTRNGKALDNRSSI